MPRHSFIALLAAACCALVPAAPAAAHEGNPDFESLVDSVTPAVSGFTAQILNGDDRVEVVNRSKDTVVIEGYSDEPYIRMRPNGEIAVNQRSEAAWINQSRFGEDKVPDTVDAKAPPEWKVVDRTGRYEFHDHRMHWMAKTTPQQVKDKKERTKIYDWKIPMAADGKTVAITGTLFWRGDPGGDTPIGAIIGLVVLALGGLALVIVVRRRRAAADAAGGGPSSGGPEREAW